MFLLGCSTFQQRDCEQLIEKIIQLPDDTHHKERIESRARHCLEATSLVMCYFLIRAMAAIIISCGLWFDQNLSIPEKNLEQLKSTYYLGNEFVQLILIRLV